jgi:hypothetical protein
VIASQLTIDTQFGYPSSVKLLSREGTATPLGVLGVFGVLGTCGPPFVAEKEEEDADAAAAAEG